jgi:hypothetical protein
VTWPACLDPVEALDAIHRLLDECDESIGYTKHSEDRMAERNVTADDVLSVLRCGMVTSSAWNETFKNCTYEVTGRDCDLVPLAVVVALQPARCRITLITVKDA